MTARLVIVGAGGHGKVVADAARAMQRWQEIVFVDEFKPVGSRVADWLVLGKHDYLAQCHDAGTEIFVALGDNATRMQTIAQVEAQSLTLATIIHPESCVSQRVSIAAGTFIAAKAVVNIDASLGKGCIVNTAAVIEHDCQLAAGVHVSPNAALAGAAKVGLCSWIGIGASVLEKRCVGDHCIVGAGAVVVEDTASHSTVAGVPAKALIRQPSVGQAE